MLKQIIICVMLILECRNVMACQTTLDINRPLDTQANLLLHRKTEFGITTGYFLFFYNAEFSMAKRKKVSKSVVLKAKPVMGLFVQAFLFDGKSRGYNIYIGGAGGMTAGKKR